MSAVVQTKLRSVSGQGDLLATAYRDHGNILKSYLLRTINESDAEDLMQDVFLRLAGHHDLGVIDNLKAFMFTTATNLLRDRWRRANARFAPFLINVEGLNLVAEASDPAEVTEWRESLTRVQKELERLPDKSRQAFELNRLGGFSYADIADVMAVSVSMIEKHISLALGRLRLAL